MPVYQLMVGFHNIVEESVNARFLLGGKQNYWCAKDALHSNAPFALASAKNHIDTSCKAFAVPGITQTHPLRNCAC